MAGLTLLNQPSMPDLRLHNQPSMPDLTLHYQPSIPDLTLHYQSSTLLNQSSRCYTNTTRAISAFFFFTLALPSEVINSYVSRDKCVQLSLPCTVALTVSSLLNPKRLQHISHRQVTSKHAKISPLMQYIIFSY